jgi:S-DNA-T family DNA segregation ATPase FtsK/SpoIIIE
MVDPKRVELTLYNGIPHLLTPVITEPKKAILALKWAAKEMERRYDIFEKEKVRDISSYHAKMHGNDNLLPMPYIVVVVDELADIMQAYPRELEAGIVRLAQMSRAVGIHLILSTQRPSVNVITGLIKANVPTRLALQVASQIDSRTILDAPGAEKLLGAGDMLFLSGDRGKPVRLQTAFISEDEVKNVVSYIKKHNSGDLSSIDFSGGSSNGEDGDSAIDAIMNSTLDEDVDDDLYEEAKKAVLEAGKASTSYLQRKLRIGYSRAARLIDLLEEKGVIGSQDGSKPREVIGSTRKADTDHDEPVE